MMIQGDVRDVLPTLDAGSVHCVVTSPPYWGLRDYGVDNQIGLEPTPEEYVQTMVEVFRAVRRVLRDDGTVWLNLGDTYAGGGGFSPDAPSNRAGSKQTTIGGDSKTKGKPVPCDLKPKDLVGIPWRVAFALQADGWYLRSDMIWAKGVSFCSSYAGSVMPESVTDRPTKSHEYLFLLTKSARYYYDAEAVREPSEYGYSYKPAMYERVGDAKRTQTGTQGKTSGGSNGVGGSRNLRSVWTINPKPYTEAHFATFPPALVEPCIKAGSSETGVCGSCGAPWVRQVTAAGGAIGKGYHDHADDLGAGQSQCKKLPPAGYTRTTTGWSPACACQTTARDRAVVLDPFAGSGTTGLVAQRLGRRFVGIELNEDYLALARDRVEGRLFAAAASGAGGGEPDELD